MAISEGGPVFLKVVDTSGEIKSKHYIADRMAELIQEVGEENVIQVITDNAPVCKAAGMVIESSCPKGFWTPCFVHTLNLALKNISAAKNTERNEVVWTACNWITQTADDVSFVRNFIMNHSMRNVILKQFSTFKLLDVSDTRFASFIVMLRRFKFFKRSLQSMIISEEWNSYREDDTEPIYNMVRVCDIDASTLHLVCEMWDSMIDKVKASIYRHQGNDLNDTSISPFYSVVYSILIDRWTKSCTPLHWLAHSLNPRYYNDEWLSEDPNRVSPHEDEEISTQRNNYRWVLGPKSWWVMHGSPAPLLQKLALKLLVLPSSSSCCEINWSTYSFIHSLKRNKLNPKSVEDLVYVHTKLRLLGRKCEEYKKGSTKMWDIGGDAWESFDGVVTPEVASLSLDDPNLEATLFTDNGEGGDDIDTISIS
ncbi:uncharacterized protein LOC131635251 [Vicia villosa]|uniref:uncharacterized protein LOC131635251 n=1 Tax=Vicia villosa TaxID=3911 RepID=UPI00273BFD33|nr:uncharacterized protein LOC131635251 [Vicia villosa]